MHYRRTSLATTKGELNVNAITKAIKKAAEKQDLSELTREGLKLDCTDNEFESAMAALKHKADREKAAAELLKKSSDTKPAEGSDK